MVTADIIQQAANRYGVSISASEDRIGGPIVEFGRLRADGTACFDIGAVYRQTDEGLMLAECWPGTVDSDWPHWIEDREQLEGLLEPMAAEMDSVAGFLAVD